MSSERAFRIVLMAAFGGAFLGGLVGFLLGLLLPHYYASVFSGPVDPLQTGIGLGVSQGLLAGGLFGLGVVAILAWREVRLKEIESRKREDYPRPNLDVE